MAVTYTWDFEQLDRDVEKDGLDDVVTAISWRLSGLDDGGKQASIHAKTQISSPDADDFLAYADVTKAAVKSWVLGAVKEDEDTLEETEDILKTRVEKLVLEQITPTKEFGVPSSWS